MEKIFKKVKIISVIEIEYEIRDEKYYLNLWEVNTQILKEFGVLKSNIINMNICTSCNCDRFFSYRKHEKTPKRIGTFIEIK